ncbi:MAG: adenylate/guanylate cyclase domain-containing protein [Paracoccaceae bacterium]|nr:adenylate/guanylate cyclase domain-containing protein [Paracoccaceae bacterium]
MDSQKIDRKIAVIFATDVVGFSTSMEIDEDQTLKNFRACKNILEDLFKEHSGRIFNTAGDSVLAEFSSAVSAVLCASEFQKLIQERNASSSLPENGKMEFRVGLNMGDVIVEGTNLYGDGVNVAARLEALAQPNGVCLSKSIHDFVNKKTEFLFDDLGEQKVKNTNVHAFDIIIDPSGARRKKNIESAPSAQAAEEDSRPPAIAVLPFLNMSGDPEQEYFADGITEDIISNLSLWKTFPVISRNSSFSFKGQSLKASEIAEKLNVRYIVEGSVRKGGNKVRISAQLIDASSDSNLWSKRWDKSLDDIFEVQDEVSSAIAAMVAPVVKGQEQVKLASRKSVNMTAWDYYLRALSAFNNDESSDTVTELCDKSIELQSDISDPYVLYCRVLVNDILNGDSEKQAKRADNEVKLHKFAKIAYELDGENPDAVIVYSRSFNIKRDYNKRIELAKKAIELNPNHAGANFDYGLAITNLGDFEGALVSIKKAMELNPMQQKNFRGFLPLIYIGLKDFDSALKCYKESEENGPLQTGVKSMKAAVLAHLGRIDEGKAVLAEYLEVRTAVKSLKDYEKFAPTIIKEILMDGLEILGLPKN